MQLGQSWRGVHSLNAEVEGRLKSRKAARVETCYDMARALE